MKGLDLITGFSCKPTHPRNPERKKQVIKQKQQKIPSKRKFVTWVLPCSSESMLQAVLGRKAWKIRGHHRSVLLPITEASWAWRRLRGFRDTQKACTQPCSVLKTICLSTVPAGLGHSPLLPHQLFLLTSPFCPSH